MSDETIIVRLPAKCGTCDHDHAAGLGCALCGCVTFTLHDNARAAQEEAEHRDLIEFNGTRTVLSGLVADHMMVALKRWETDITAEGVWDRPPVLAAIGFGECAEEHRETPTAETHLASIFIHALDLPGSYWRQADNPVDVLAAMADQARADPTWFAALRYAAGFHPDQDVAGWAFVFEAYAKNDAGERHDELRAIAACDLDGRQYSVVRKRAASTVEAILEAPARFRERSERDYRARKQRGAPIAAGPPRINEALRRLATVTAAEAMLRALIAKGR